MDRNGAIAEIDWYADLVRRKAARWGRGLAESCRVTLVGNVEDVAERRETLRFIQDKEGYYIGETDEEGLRQGYGIFTRTLGRDRWTMQAGFWQEGRPMGSHTLYDASGPREQHFLASVYYSGERRRERGTVEYSVSAGGFNGRPRKYRRYEGFSLSTMVVGLSVIYILSLLFTRNARIGLLAVIVVAVLYLIGCTRRQDGSR